MALTGRRVELAAALAPAREPSSCLDGNAACEGDSATPSSAACRRAPAGRSPLSQGERLDDAPLPSVYPSSFAAKSPSSFCPSAPVPQTSQCFADQAAMPALLVICLSPELLRSPTCSRRRRQEVQQEQQPALHLQQAQGQQQQSWQQYTQAGREEEIAEKGSPATPSHVRLPPDSPVYIFLAQQFLPALGPPVEEGIATSSNKFHETPFKGCVSPADLARSQQGKPLCKQAGDQEQSLGVNPQQKQYQQPLHCEQETDRPCRLQGLLQPPLRQLPATCLLRTKYYEAPLRLLYQFFESTARDSGDPTSTASVAPADANTSSSRYSGSGALLHLENQPEAVLFLCSSLADLYRAHELLDAASQERFPPSPESCGISRQEAATIAAAAAAAEGAQSLPLPHFLRQPPYIVTGGHEQRRNPGAGAAAAAGGKGESDRDKFCDDGPVTTGRAEGRGVVEGDPDGAPGTAKEGEMPPGNWLSTVPVKLLVCFDADEKMTAHREEKSGDGGATANKCSFLPPYECYEDYEDPSDMLFFENACFLEKVSLSLPTQSVREDVDKSAPEAISFLEEKSKEQALAGTMAAEAPAAVSKDAEASKEKAGVREKLSWCSVRPLLGTSMSRSRGSGTDDGSMRAVQRVVEALHCNMWPNMRLLENSATYRKRGTVVASDTPQQSAESGSDLASTHDDRIGEGTIHVNVGREGAPSKRTDAEVSARTGSAVRGERETGGHEQGKATPAAGLHRRGGAAAAREITTDAPEFCAVREKARSMKLDPDNSDIAPTFSAGDHRAAGGCAPAPRRTLIVEPQECGARREANEVGKNREKPPEEMSFHGWDSFARTVREVRLEAPQLSHAERVAKAEILTLQLAHALGLSDEENDE